MKIIIAPTSYHKEILNNERASNPFINIKVLSKENLLSFVLPQIKIDALIYLMVEKDYTYDISKMFLTYLPYFKGINSDNPKLILLSNLYKELKEKGFIYTQELKINYFKNEKVLIYGYSNKDIELLNAASVLGFTPIFVSKEINECINFDNKELGRFEKVENEVIYVLNKIASLIKSGVDINDIYIFCRDNAYSYYLNKFSKSFGYLVNVKNEDTWSSSGVFAEFKKIYLENKNINESLENLHLIMKDDDQFEEFSKIVKETIVKGMSFEKQRDFTFGYVKEKKLPTNKYKNAVKVITSPIFVEGKYIFVMGFTQGLFPKASKDNDYLNNEEHILISKLNSKQKTCIDNELLIAFFNTPNFFTYTYASKSMSGTHYASPLLNKNAPLLDDVSDTFYSEELLKSIYADAMDMETFFNEGGERLSKIKNVIESEYGSYDNQVKGHIKAFDENIKIGLSTSALDSYNSCAYYYYLSSVLKLDKDNDVLTMKIGNICHGVLEHCFDENFDFETCFAEKIKDLQFSPAELYILNHSIKDQLITAIEALKCRHKYSSNPQYWFETDLSYYLDDKTYISGRVDFIEVTDNDSLFIVDYKTGSKKFDDNKFEHGLSTQLPTYALMAMGSNDFSIYKIGGLYINNILTNKSADLIKDDDELIPGYLKLNGKTINSLNGVLEFDNTLSGGTSSFITGVGCKDGQLKSNKSIISENELNQYIDKLILYYKDMNKKLRENAFNISPLIFSQRDNPCSYCSFKDVCYVKRHQQRIVVKEEEENE